MELATSASLGQVTSVQGTADLQCGISVPGTVIQETRSFNIASTDGTSPPEELKDLEGATVDNGPYSAYFDFPQNRVNKSPSTTSQVTLSGDTITPTFAIGRTQALPSYDDQDHLRDQHYDTIFFAPTDQPNVYQTFRADTFVKNNPEAPLVTKMYDLPAAQSVTLTVIDPSTGSYQNVRAEQINTLLAASNLDAHGQGTICHMDQHILKNMQESYDRDGEWPLSKANNTCFVSTGSRTSNDGEI